MRGVTVYHDLFLQMNQLFQPQIVVKQWLLPSTLRILNRIISKRKHLLPNDIHNLLLNSLINLTLPKPALDNHVPLAAPAHIHGPAAEAAALYVVHGRPVCFDEYENEFFWVRFYERLDFLNYTS